ncbi:MAG TPA: hypothetical protein VLH75_12575 [Longimicrobiales bacterium]|nr:hypothetical protein [Longimicrobiales bacterium]
MTSMNRLLTPALVAIPLLSCAPAERAPEPADAPAAGALVDPAWDVQHEDSTQRFIALSIVDSVTVWVAGQPGLWGRTTDGGATWTVAKVPGADTLAFRDVHAFSAEEAFVLSIGNGEASRIYRTVDGGATWALSFLNEDPDAFFDCLSFWDRERGIAFSDSHDGEFTLIRTGDGGATWTRVDPGSVPDARPGEGAFAASGTCVATRSGGLGWFVTGASQVDTRVMRTSDYGVTWTEAPTPVPSTKSDEGLASLAFFDDLRGAAFGTAHDSSAVNVAVTSDGGVTWVPAGRALSGIVYGGAVVPGAPTPTLVAVSPEGSAWSADNGSTWTVFDTANYWTVAFLSADIGWAGGRGRISRIGRRGP